MWYIVCCTWYIVCSTWYIVCCMWYIVCCTWYIVCCTLSVARCLSHVVCRTSMSVARWMVYLCEVVLRERRVVQQVVVQHREVAHRKCVVRHHLRATRLNSSLTAPSGHVSTAASIRIRVRIAWAIP